MHGVEDLGLLKMDFLGLRNLDVIEVTLDLVEQRPAPAPTSTTSRSTTRRPSSCCARATPIGVFQLEGGPMRALMRSLAPTSFEDVVRADRALPARARWPRTGTTSTPTARTAGSRSPTRTPSSRSSSAPTYGLMIYQEQLMRVAQQLAGYSLEDADNLRKATGKKIRELIAKERTKFVDGCVAQGHDARVRAGHLRHDRAVRRLLVQQVALGRVRLPGVPDGLPEGELHGRVPRCAAHERQEQQGQGRGVPQRVPAAGHPGARPRRERVRPGLRATHRRRHGHRSASPPCGTWGKGRCAPATSNTTWCCAPRPLRLAASPTRAASSSSPRAAR